MRPRALTWLLLVAGVALAARRGLDVVVVRGRSMTPALLPGDRLLVARARPRPGDVVLAADPRAPSRELVKRVVAMDRQGIALAGDNSSGTSDAIVEPAAVRWRAVVRYWPPSRVGVVARRSASIRR
jgi:phage repressor protein C with HTH and peptisase S24 domain